mmetsp:Transcript_42035/g.130959  ORF Transcript_42035/g.130959 Transcript_42035/m.130959 type:complete len:368 (-) Transcript_42035:442-1545(-)
MPNAGVRLKDGALAPPPTSSWARLAPMYRASARVAASRGTTISQQTSSLNCVPSVSGRVSGSRRESTPESRMSLRRLWLGMSALFARGRPVMGEVDFSESHASMLRRSYVWPSQVLTASRITSCVMGQRNSCGMSESFTKDGLEEDPRAPPDPPVAPAGGSPCGSAICARIHLWKALPPLAWASLTSASRPPPARDSVTLELAGSEAVPSRTRQYCSAASSSRTSAGTGRHPPPNCAMRSSRACWSPSLRACADIPPLESECSSHLWGSNLCQSSCATSSSNSMRLEQSASLSTSARRSALTVVSRTCRAVECPSPSPGAAPLSGITAAASSLRSTPFAAPGCVATWPPMTPEASEEAIEAPASERR